MEGLLHLFAFFFDDMIDFEKVNQGSHVRFLCRGLLWTVFEKERLERRHRAWRIVSRFTKSVAEAPFDARHVPRVGLSDTSLNPRISPVSLALSR